MQMPAVSGYRKSARLALRDGFSGVHRQRSVLKAEWVDELYRDHDPEYLRACELLVALAKNFEIVIFSTFNYLHPEIIAAELGAQTKVLGFSDDPHSTYVRGIPYLWAFDAAYFISPSYSSQTSFAELFAQIGFTKVRWLPLAQPIAYPQLSLEQITNRGQACCYVGNPTGSKLDRLAYLKRHLGNDFLIYGRWPLNGFYGFVRPLVGESPFFHKVRAVSAAEKERLYLDTKIGFNMHVSDLPAECGNMRTYETAAFGMMPLCDRGAQNLQSSIFEENTEAIYYSSSEEALEKFRHYRANDRDRAKIAFAAHRRAIKDYRWETVMLDFLRWL